jgi:hypothetical protein
VIPEKKKTASGSPRVRDNVAADPKPSDAKLVTRFVGLPDPVLELKPDRKYLSSGAWSETLK